MFSSITIDDAAGSPVALHADGGKRRVFRASGLTGIQTPRQVIRPRPTAHGAINGTRWTEGRLIVLEGRIHDASSAADAFAEFRTVTTPLLETLDAGAALLKWTERDGLALQAAVKLFGEVEPPAEVGPNILVYQAQLLAEDPRAYSQSLNTTTGGTLSVSSGGLTFPRTIPITFAASSGGTAAVNNVGNRSTAPIFRVYGMVVNPQILLVGTTSRIALTGTVGAGDYLEISVADRTITLNGTSPALQYLDAASTTWFELPRGTSTIQLLAGSFDAVARVDVLYRAAYT
jgi:hypothetical protein